MKKIIPLAVIFLTYEICFNFNWDGLLGTTIISMVMTWFILNKLDKLEKKEREEKTEKKEF